MDGGKKQVFPYSFRTVAAGSHPTYNFPMCNMRYFFQIIPPENALTIENIFTHIVLQFDASVAVANRIVQSIGITDEIPLILANANYQRRLTLNMQADANRRIDLALDLSALLKRDTPACYIELLLSANLYNVSTIGVFELWKADGLYTTTGIR